MPNSTDLPRRFERARKPGLSALFFALVFATPMAPAAEPLEVSFELGSLAGATSPTAAVEISRDLPLRNVAASGAFSVLVRSPSGYLPTSVGLWTTDAAGQPLDQLGPVPLALSPCPTEAVASAACARAGPVVLVAGAVEKGHPELQGRALVARIGGQVIVETGGTPKSAAVLGPRALENRVHRFRVRAHVLRTFAGGTPATGSDAAAAVTQVESAIDEAAGLWGQCGFALAAQAGDVLVVDPPKGVLLEVGCHGGLPARGGTVELLVRGRPLTLVTRSGESPGSVAARLGLELVRRGIRPRVVENPATESSAGPSYDVIVPSAGPSYDVRAPVSARLSTDPTLGVCLAEVDLADGLEHFEDETARAGSREERALLRGLADTDPRTIDLVVVPYFSGRGRIGESFIGEGGASLENLVILDRAGLRATARSSTLAHEIGHILLAQPGHPDDFGLDTPSRLMDADASDATAFGPRRLSIEECRRALGQHGSTAPVPLLEPVAAQPGSDPRPSP